MQLIVINGKVLVRMGIILVMVMFYGIVGCGNKPKIVVVITNPDKLEKPNDKKQITNSPAQRAGKSQFYKYSNPKLRLIHGKRTI